MPDINLVLQEEKTTERFESLKKRLLFAAEVLLGLTLVFALGVLVFFTTQVSKRTQLFAKVEESAQAINSYRQQEELLVVAKDKVGLAEQILVQRVEYHKTFVDFSKLVPQGKVGKSFVIFDSLS